MIYAVCAAEGCDRLAVAMLVWDHGRAWALLCPADLDQCRSAGDLVVPLTGPTTTYAA